MGKNIITAVTLVAGGTLAVLNSTILTPILPVIMAEMEVSATTVQWLASLFMLVNAVVVPVTAYVMGRFDVRTLFGASMVILAAGSLVCLWSPGFGTLLAGRAVQAVSSGILMPLIITVLMLLFPPEKRGTVMGVYLLAVSVSPAVGPVLVGMFADTIGWRMVFAITAGLALVLLAAGSLLLDRSTSGKPCTLDTASVVLSAVPLLCLLYGFSSISSGNLALVAALVVVGIGGLALFVGKQLRMEVPYLDVRVLGVHRYAVGTALGALANAVLTAITVVLPLFLQNACGATPTESGLAVAPIAAGAAIVSVVAGRLFDVFGARVSALAGTVLMAGATAAMLFVNLDTPLLVTSLLAALVGMGCMATNVPMNTYAINALPNDLISHGNAVGSTLRQVASSLGTALAVTIMTVGSALCGSGNAAQVVLAGAMAAFAFNFVLAAASLALAVFGVRKQR
ncbi:MAG: DHA2 family efflux MFS transporter permease subunit [Coriobacteriia bacterium]|nr:DHA2 family efflux MFS transporter permease subunit [Coriobacteriia bacterium]